ncbi:hypothetical protein QBC39DRAFT_286223 [Podospora conica]|nr:hypothetical protein QBC39DRAFT_286223 [Schizothecium conicum]
MGDRLEKTSSEVRKRIEGHAFSDEAGEEYEGSEFGGFGDYFRRKKIKLQNLDAEMRARGGGDKPQIFKGVVAHVSGYTQPSLQVLHKELVQHGAGFLQYLDGKTMATHIIASSMPPKKATEFTKYRVVKPAWVVDSIQAGHLLPWSDYRVLDNGPGQKTIQFNSGQMFSQATQQTPRSYREQSDNSFYTKQFRAAGVGLNSQGSSSPFQSSSIKKPPFVLSRRTEAIDDMDLDTDTPQSPSITLGANRKLRDAVEDEPEVTPEKTIESPMRPMPERRDIDESPSKKKALTSEEHNANLLKDPKIWKSTTANPDFLKQYYSESRLHHLSTWKAQLKARMQAMAAARGPVTKRVRRKGVRRYVMHVDFDSFFCAVSLKQAPEFRDNPAVVAHSAGSGSEIASCNYPARKFGVKNGMWMKKAMELCPDLKVLPYDFPAYEEASRLFYDAILDVGGIVQSVSIDEALVDITDIILADTGSDGLDASKEIIGRERERADEIASNLRDVIKDRTDCHVSVGMGANILLAKVALRKAKPAGQYQIQPDEVLDILGELAVESLPGVAYSIGGRLEEMGIKYVKDLRQTSKERLTTILGPKTGEKLWEYSRGIDHADVGEQPIRKSVSAEVNWGIRFVGQDEADAFLRNLAQELERRLLAEGVRGKHFTMKIMRRAHDAPLDPPKHLGHGKCDTFNKSKTFGVATHDHEIIAKEAISILRSYKFTPGDIRGIGLQMTKLEPLKTTTAGLDGSQRKLNFGNFTTAAATKKPIPEQIYDNGDAGPSKPAENTNTLEDDDDPISFDPLTPRKPRVHPALALSKASAMDLKATVPLNIAGSQFIFPTHPDPSAVAAMPPNILEQLFAQRERASKPPSRPASPPPPSVAADLDLPPGIDLKTYLELPDEFKAEALAYYRHLHNSAGPSRPAPPPPRPNPPVKHTIKTFLPKKARGGGPRPKGPIQTTLIPPQPTPPAPPPPPDRNKTPPPPSPNFLAALPDDLRAEVLADHERQLAVHARRRPRPFFVSRRERGAVAFAPLPPKAALYGRRCQTTDEAKELLRAWMEDAGDAGPHAEDVERLGRYLGRVVAEERNMEKARQIVRWLDLEVEGLEGERARGEWRGAMGVVKGEVQRAMKERGLGAMELG